MIASQLNEESEKKVVFVKIFYMILVRGTPLCDTIHPQPLSLHVDTRTWAVTVPKPAVLIYTTVRLSLDCVS